MILSHVAGLVYAFQVLFPKFFDQNCRNLDFHLLVEPCSLLFCVYRLLQYKPNWQHVYLTKDVLERHFE